MDEDRLGTRCVIKQFSPQIQGTKSLEKAVSLFNQEAVRLYDLGEHPQIPNLLAYFEQDGLLYLVQQFIEGQNLLQEVRQQGPFNERQIRDVLADILPVLRFVHNHQVIHRDITPMNILRRQNDGRLMLIDFGIAKRLSEAASGEAGTRIGTEGYAPMEQFRGGKAYPASDLYSLGATCLHLVTEIRPDQLYDPLEGRWMWREHLREKGLVVSDQFADILDKMLKDLVGDRYQSADDVMRDLNADYFLPHQKGTKPVSSPRSASSTPAATSGSARPISSPKLSEPKPSASKPLTSTPTSRPPTSKPAVVFSNGGKCVYTLSAHSSWVTTIAIAPNNQILASGSLDDTIKLWNLTTGDLIATLGGHSKGVNAVTISPHGQTLTSGGDDYTIKTWNLQTGALLRTLAGHSRDVTAVVISPNGQFLISGAEDRTIKIWQMGTGNLLKTILGVGSMVKALAISPDGKVLVSGGFDAKIKLWSLQTAEQTGVLTGHISAVNALAISSNNQLLASASKDKTVKLWNLRTGELVKTLNEHSRDVNALTFTPNGQTLASGSSDTTIKLWNPSTGQVIDTLAAHADSVNTLAITSDGNLLVSGSSDSTIRVWRL
jgi:WD40 repeat protein